MKATIYTKDGTKKGEITLPPEVFECEVNMHLMHQVVTMYLANQRQGTAKAKSRSEVSGGGKKPFRQKGTGRARAGSNASPVWVRGGKAFGPKPRDYTATIPKKIRKVALRSALSSRAQEQKILIVDRLEHDEPKTQKMAALLQALAIAGKKNLLILEAPDRNIFLSGRNIRGLRIKTAADINTYDVLNCENVVFGAEQCIELIKQVVGQ